MLPTISASPNPITVFASGITHSGTTQISWATGDAAVFGTVTYTIDAGPEIPFDGGPSHTSGLKVTPRLEFGKDYVFLLRRVDNNALLRQLHIGIEETLGLPPSFVGSLLDRTPQGITDLRVSPGVDSVRISFKTLQPTLPSVEIRDAAGFLVGAALPLLATPAQKFDFNFKAGSGLTNPLAQDSVFNFVIKAPPRPGSHWPEVDLSGSFRSGSRTATVFFDSFNVSDVGDADEFKFEFCVGDPETGSPLVTEQWWGRGSLDWLDTFATRSLGISFPIAHAPETIGAQVYASAWDTGVFSTDYLPTYEPKFGMEGTAVTTNGDSSTTQVTKNLDLSGAVESPTDVSFVLQPDPGGPIDFTVNCKFRMQAQKGVVIAPDVVVPPSPPLRPIQWTAAMTEQLGAVILGQGDQTMVARLAGETIFAAPKPAGSLRNLRYVAVASGVHTPVIVASSAGRLNFFTLGQDGQVLHRSYSAGAGIDDNWHSLGGRFVSQAVAVAHDRVELFGLGHDHRVMHCTLGAGDWQVVGEGITGSLNAFTSPKGEIVLVAVGRNSEILFGLSSTPREWKSLGPAPDGELLSAAFSGDDVVFASLRKDQTVLAAPWRTYPNADSKLQWEAVGTVTSLVNSRFSLLSRRAS